MTSSLEMLQRLPDIAAEVWLTRNHPNPGGEQVNGRSGRNIHIVPLDLTAYDMLRPDDHGMLAKLSMCVRMVAEELRDTDQMWPKLTNPPTWVSECGWLIETAGWWQRQAWRDDIDHELAGVWREMTRAARITPPLRLTCTQCNFPVYPEADGSYYRCEAGHTIMLKPELERLGKIQEYTSAELAELMGITDRTLRRWKAAGIITPVGKLGKQDTYSVLDVQRAREKVRA